RELLLGQEERQAEKAFGSGHARQRDFEGFRNKKTHEPTALDVRDDSVVLSAGLCRNPTADRSRVPDRAAAPPCSLQRRCGDVRRSISRSPSTRFSPRVAPAAPGARSIVPDHIRTTA